MLVCSNNLNFCNLPVHLNGIDKAKELYSITNDKILMGGDFNAQVSDRAFCSIWNLKSLGKDPTCFKNPNNPSCVLFLLFRFISNQQY